MSHAPQEQSWLTWRAVVPADEDGLRRLDAACKKADGYEPVSNLPGDVLSAIAEDPDNAFCASEEELIAAVGWIQPRQDDERENSALLGGRVHPDYRRRGLGAVLLEWAELRAVQALKSDLPLRLVIRNEALSADAHAMYQDYGFEQDFSEHMLVRTLEEPLPDASLPPGLSLRNWDEHTAETFFKAYQLSFADRPGFPNPAADEWISEYESDADFRQDLSRVVIARQQQPVAFITLGELGGMGWISQVGVAQEWRGQGIAQALLAEALHQFKLHGYQEAGLHVNTNNANAAMVFHQLGFRRRLTRARYVKVI